MTIAEQKIKLINKISSANNPVLIEEMMKLIDINQEEKEYTFSESQKKTILLAQEQLRSGDYLSHKEAKKQSKKWLEE